MKKSMPPPTHIYMGVSQDECKIHHSNVISEYSDNPYVKNTTIPT